MIITYILYIGKLPVLDLAEQEQRTVQTRQTFKRFMRLYQLFQLLFAEIAFFHQHFQTVPADSQRCLHLVGCISDKQFLLFIQFLTALCRKSHGFIQLAELINAGIILQWSIRTAEPIGIQPGQQAVQRMHISPEHPYVQQNNGQQQQYIKKDNPPQNSSLQISFLDSRCINDQLHKAVSFGLEDGSQYTSRFLFVLLCDINHFIVIRNPGIHPGIRLAYFIKEILVVGAIATGRKFLTGKPSEDQCLRIVFQRIIYLVIDFFHHGQIKQSGP